MCSPAREPHRPSAMCSPTPKTQIAVTREMCPPSLKTHLTSDICSPTKETHITTDMCSSGLETHTTSDTCSPTRQTHIIVKPYGEKIVQSGVKAPNLAWL